jgi:hypothetical protein
MARNIDSQVMLVSCSYSVLLLQAIIVPIIVVLLAALLTAFLVSPTC